MKHKLVILLVVLMLAAMKFSGVQFACARQMLITKLLRMAVPCSVCWTSG